MLVIQSGIANYHCIDIREAVAFETAIVHIEPTGNGKKIGNLWQEDIPSVSPGPTVHHQACS